MEPAMQSTPGPSWVQPPPVDGSGIDYRLTGESDVADSHDYTADLVRDRHNNDLKLKYRFENIFSKFSKDFTGIGDEVDLVTGEVIVNNGHLRFMNNYTDLGRKRRRVESRSVSDVSDEEGSDGDVDVTDQEPAEGADEEQNGDGLEDDQDATASDSNAESDTGSDITDVEDLSSAAQLQQAGPGHCEDVWNDIPPLPGDSGYMPLPGSSARPGFSENATRELQDSIGNQITQFLEGLRDQAETTSPNTGALSAPGGQLPAQVTINLDPKSADFGRPIFHYAPSVAQKRALPQNDNIHTNNAKRPRLAEKGAHVKTPSEISAAVARRIAAAGLPDRGDLSNFTLPKPNGVGQNGKASHLLKGESRVSDLSTTDFTENGELDVQKSARQYLENLRAQTEETLPFRDIPIDPSLDASTNLLHQAPPRDRAIATEEEASRATSTAKSQYSANTGRPLTVNKVKSELSEEDAELLLEVKERRKMKWHEVREVFFPERSIYSLQHHYYTFFRAQKRLDLFTEQDDILLLELKETENMEWDRIRREYFPEMKLPQLQHRYYSKLSAGTKIYWTEEEDNLLIHLRDVKCLDWVTISKQYFSDRPIGRVQYRYYRYVRPADWKEKLVKLAEAEYEKKERRRSELLAGAQRRRPKKYWTDEQGELDDDGKNEEGIDLLRIYHRRLAASSSQLGAAKRKWLAEKRAQNAGKNEKSKGKRKAKQKAAKEIKLTSRSAQAEQDTQDDETESAEQLEIYEPNSSQLDGPEYASDNEDPGYEDTDATIDKAVASVESQSTFPVAPQRSMKRQLEDALARYADYNELDDSDSINGTPTPNIAVHPAASFQSDQNFSPGATGQELPPLCRPLSARKQSGSPLPTKLSPQSLSTPAGVAHKLPGQNLGRVLLPKPSATPQSMASDSEQMNACAAQNGPSTTPQPETYSSPYLSPHPGQVPGKAAWARKQSRMWPKSAYSHASASGSGSPLQRGDCELQKRQAKGKATKKPAEREQLGRLPKPSPRSTSPNKVLTVDLTQGNSPEKLESKTSQPFGLREPRHHHEQDHIPQLDGASDIPPTASSGMSALSVCRRDGLQPPKSDSQRRSPLSRATLTASLSRSKETGKSLSEETRVIEISDSEEVEDDEISEHESDYQAEIQKPAARAQSRRSTKAKSKVKVTPLSHSASLHRKKSAPRAKPPFAEDSMEDLSMSRILVKPGRRAGGAMGFSTPKRSLVTTPSGSRGPAARSGSIRARGSAGSAAARTRAIVMDDGSEDELAL